MTVVLANPVRAAVVVCAALALVGVGGTPARAHGPTPDASNFSSRITGVVAMDDGAPAGAVDAPAGVTWRVLGADALLTVRNTGDEDLVVAGYDGEPYLRIGPEGVFENRRSTATYITADRFGMTQVPPHADAGAAPDWRQVGSDPQWQWHDHRIHWMARTQPPQVQRRPDVVHTIQEWSVPFAGGERQFGVQGVLRWIPSGPVWPWLTGAAVLLSLPVLVPLVRRRGERRVVRALVGVTTAVALAAVVVAVGDVIATPASVAADALALLQAVAPAVVAVALVASLWRTAPTDGESDPAVTVLIAAVILAIACGVVRLGALQSSQVVNALAPWVVRAGVAACLMVVVPALLVILAMRRSPEPS